MYSSLNTIYFRIVESIKNGTIEKRSADQMLAEQIKTYSNELSTIKTMSLTDSLTGLNNRRAFDEKMLIACKRKQDILALIDIDNFKTVNDQYGHSLGDMVLQTVAVLGIRLCGLSDISLYRYGGEEIAVIFREMSPEEAFDWLDRWRKAVSKRSFREKGLRVSFSGGLSPIRADTPQEAIALVDDYLYRAKRAGKNQIFSIKID